MIRALPGIWLALFWIAKSVERVASLYEPIYQKLRLAISTATVKGSVCPRQKGGF